MSDRFAPIPYAALAAAGRHGRLAVLDLYTRAHTASWAPFRSTDRDLAEEWGVDRRRVTSIIDALTSAGFLSVTRPDKWCARTFTVREPFSEPETIAPQPPQLTLVEPASVPASVPNAGGGSHARAEPNRTEPNRTEVLTQTQVAGLEDLFNQDMKRLTEQGMFGKNGKDNLPPDFLKLYAHHMSLLGLPQEPTKTERLAIIRCIKRFNIHNVIAVFVWACTSEEFTAKSNRDKGLLRSETPWRLGRGGELGNFERYLDLATAARVPTVNQKGGAYSRPADAPLPSLPPVDDDLPF